ncbi:unnamed protein product, partial [Mesorhabditis belari]|uniref:Uncharacterized protein n=1 Tax=Mesorhabditis belari TaxID=2138241 RepID=A0AAF3EFP7_9BILA
MLGGKKHSTRDLTAKNSSTKDVTTKSVVGPPRRKYGIKGFFGRFKRVSKSSSKSSSPPVITSPGSPEKTRSNNTTHSMQSNEEASLKSGESLPTPFKENANLRTILYGNSSTSLHQELGTASNKENSFESIPKLGAVSPICEGIDAKLHSELSITRSFSTLSINRSAKTNTRNLRRVNSSNSPTTPVSRLRTYQPKRTTATIPEHGETSTPTFEDFSHDGFGSRRITLGDPTELLKVPITPQAARGNALSRKLLSSDLSTPRSFGGSNNSRQISHDETQMGISMLVRRDTLDSQKQAPALKRRRFSEVSNFKIIKQRMAQKACSEDADQEKLIRFQGSTKLIQDVVKFEPCGYRGVVIDATTDGKPYSRFSKSVIRALEAERLLLDSVLGVIPNPFLKVIVANNYAQGIVLLIALVRVKPPTIAYARGGYSGALTRGFGMGLVDFVMGPCFQEEETLSQEFADALLRTIYMEVNSQPNKTIQINVHTDGSASDHQTLMNIWEKIESEKRRRSVDAYPK